MQFFAQDPHVLRSRFVFRIEGDKNLTVSRANCRTVAKGEINSACRQPDIIKHILYFVRGNDIANGVADLKKAFLG